MFQVGYATARLQTFNRGAPVSPWTVEKELGHATRGMLEAVYGRLGTMQHRSDVVGFRVEQHFDWHGGKWGSEIKAVAQEERDGGSGMTTRVPDDEPEASTVKVIRNPDGSVRLQVLPGQPMPHP